MALAWIAATVVSVLIATAAVGAVRGRVTEGPESVAAPPTSLDSTTITTTAPSSATSSSVSSTTASTPATTGAGTSTSTSAADGGGTSTTAATSTTQGPAVAEIKTYTAVGGTVTIEVTATTIELLGATPNPGFTVSEKESSPTQIEIEFRSSDHESKVDIRLRDGVLDVSVEEGD
jgi:hypothetical protein